MKGRKQMEKDKTNCSRFFSGFLLARHSYFFPSFVQPVEKVGEVEEENRRETASMHSTYGMCARDEKIIHLLSPKRSFSFSYKLYENILYSLQSSSLSFFSSSQELWLALFSAAGTHSRCEDNWVIRPSTMATIRKNERHKTKHYTHPRLL